MNTRSCKAKGRSLQNRIAKDLAKITGLRYGSPNDDLADLRGRLMGTPGADLVRSREAMALVPFYIECKNVESWSIIGKTMFRDGLGQLIRWYLNTCDKAMGAGDASQNIPLVVAAQAHVSPIVVVRSFDGVSSDGVVFHFGPSGASDVVRVQIPISRFLDDRWRHIVQSDMILNILSWADFLHMWYGK